MNRLPPHAMDRAGYIINQSLTAPVPFGKKGSVECGCGWIAAYNLRRWQGDEVEPEQVAHTLHRLSPLSGLMGVNVIALWIYLLFLGMRPLLLPVTRKTHHRGQAGIIMYKVRKGGHYVAYIPGGGDAYCFLNGVYGLEDDRAAMGEYVRRQSRWPIALVLTARTRPARVRKELPERG